MALKAGPLTLADLQAVWESSVDATYREALLKAGDGNGLELHSVLWRMLERGSRAIDVTTQAMFIRGWSGQTNPPAGGEAKATVTLTFARTATLDRALVLGAGTMYVGEQEIDWGDEGGVEVLTGRRYLITEDLVFPPGDAGPHDVPAIAERAGYGYNNPLPDTIIAISQPGSSFTNVRASVAVVGAVATFTTANLVDQIVPEHVGQYIRFTAGANTGVVARILAFVPPAPPTTGSGAVLEQTISVRATTFAGTFTAGELATFSGGQVVRVLGVQVDGAAHRFVGALVSGNLATVVATDTLTGAASGATLTVLVVDRTELLVAETATASWRVLDWPTEWELTSTNVASPSGGVAGFLDELGADRNLARAPGEDDETYRRRMQDIGDVVTPNAIRRALSKTMGSIPWCLREVGSTLLPGFFYDGDASATGGSKVTDPVAANQIDAYDTDCVIWDGVYTSGTFVKDELCEYRDVLGSLVVRGYYGFMSTRTAGTLPQPEVVSPALGNLKFLMARKVNKPRAFIAGDTIVGLTSGAVFTPSALVTLTQPVTRRFRVLLDYVQFRAFFLVGVPRLDTGDFGFAYDVSAYGAYDASPYPDFYDGSPQDAARFYRSIFQAVDVVHAGGVSFELYVEDVGCP